MNEAGGGPDLPAAELVVQALVEEESTFAKRIAKRKLEIIEDLKNLDQRDEELQNGTHEELLAECDRSQANYTMRCKSADAMIQFFKEMLSRQLTSDRKKARAESETRRHDLILRWMQDLDREKQLLKERYDQMQIDCDIDGKMRTRPRRHKEDEALLVSRGPKKESGPTAPTVVQELRDSDIIADLASLFPPGKRPAYVPMQFKQVDAYYDQEKLWYDGRWYYRGSKVAVEWQDGSNQRLVGYIHAINPCELWIRRQDHSRASVLLSQLAKGRYVIRTSQTKAGTADVPVAGAPTPVPV